MDKPDNPHILSLENEHEEFKQEFSRVINDDDMNEADEIEIDSGIGKQDQYLNMELGISQGPDSELKTNHSKKENNRSRRKTS